MAAHPAHPDLRRAEYHANEAERLLKSRLLPSHVKAQVHATLALYYSASDSE
jgi:hypothetical protein